MKVGRYSKLLKLLFILSIVFIAVQSNKITNQLDKKARSIFKEKSTLVKVFNTVQQNQRLYYLEYQSGFKVAFSITDKSISIRSYQHSPSTKNQLASKFQDSCKTKTLSANQIDLYLRKLKQIDESYTINYFKVNTDGYIIQYSRNQYVYTFELTFDLKIKKKDSNKILGLKVINQPLQLNTNNQKQQEQQALNNVRKLFSTKSWNIQKTTRIDKYKYVIVIVITIRERQIRYKVTIKKSQSGQYNIDDGEYMIDFIPMYRQVKNFNQVKDIDIQLKKILNQKVQTQLKLIKVQIDEPFYRFEYDNNNYSSQIEFKYDQFLNKIDIINVKKTVKESLPQLNQTTVKSTTKIQVPKQSINSKYEKRTPSLQANEPKKVEPIIVQSSTKQQSNSNVVSQTKIKQIFSSLELTSSRLSKKARLDKVAKIGLSRFLITFIVSFQQRQVKYQVTINQISSNKYIIDESQYLFDFAPKYTESPNFEEVKDIDIILRNSLAQKMPSQAKLIRVQRDDPFFIFQYSLLTSKSKISFTYDLFAQKISIISIRTEKIQPTQATSVASNLQVVKKPKNTQQLQSQIKTSSSQQLVSQSGKYAQIPSSAYNILKSNQNPIIIQMAKFALQKISPGIQQIDPKKKIMNIYYYIKNPQTIIFKFEVSTTYGILTFFYEITYSSNKTQQTYISSQNIRTNIEDKSQLISKTQSINLQPQFIKKQPSENKKLVINEVPFKTSTINGFQLKGATVPNVSENKTKSNNFSEQNRKDRQILLYLKRAFVFPLPQNIQISKFSKLDTNKYLIYLVFQLSNRRVQYQVIVSQNEKGQYKVQDSQFVFDFTPSYRQLSNKQDVKDIDLILRNNLPQKIPAQSKLIKVQLDPPFYRFYYSFSAYKNKIDFSFDQFTRRIHIIGIQSQKTSQPIISISNEPINIKKQPSSVVISQNNKNLASSTQVKLLTTKIIDIENSAIPISQPITKIIRKPFTQKQTLHQITESNNFNTNFQSYFTTQKQMYQNLIKTSASQLNNLFNLLQKQLNSINFKNSKVLKIQKLAYGFRIIIQVNFLLYQAIVRFNSATRQYKLLRWANISKTQVDSVQSFCSYIQTTIDSDFQSILFKAFPTQKIGKIKKILSTKNKIESDGLYYQMILETSSGIQYEVIMYYKPEQNYIQVLSYEQFLSNKQQIKSLVEQNIQFNEQNKDLSKIFEFISSKYTNFGSASVMYMFRTYVGRLNISIYRVRLKINQGSFYQLSLSISSDNINLIKYSKLYDGYYLTQYDNTETRQVLKFYKTQILNIQNNPTFSSSQISQILVKDIPSIGKFYKLIFCIPKYSVIIAANKQGLMKINGIQAIPSYFYDMINIKYTTYGELNQLLQRCRDYQSLTNRKIVSQIKIVDKIPSYRPDEDKNCLRSDKNSCLMCVYRFFLNNGYCQPVPDQCKDYNRENGFCLSCYNGHTLKNGICSAMNPLCQFADSQGRCTQCYRGFILAYGVCLKSMNQIIDNKNFRKEVIDPLCQQYNNGICVKCFAGTYYSRRFFACTPSDPFAQQFDEINEVATKCTRGSRLSPDGKCIRIR